MNNETASQAPDIEKIRRNLSRMIDQGAPEADLDEYLNMEGVTLDQVRNGSTPQQMQGPARLPAMAASEATKGVLGTAGMPLTAAQGVYNFIGRNVTGPAINAVQRAAGAQETPYQDINIPGTAEGLQGAAKQAGIIDRLDLRPQGSGEKMLALAAEGAGAGGPFGMQGAALGAAGNLAGEGGAELVKNMGGDSVWQMVGRIVGAIGVPGAIQGTARQVGKIASSMRGGAMQNQDFAQFQRQGVRPTPSDVTPEGSMSSKMEAAAGRAAGGGPVVRANQQQITDIERRVEGMAGEFGIPTGREAGGAAVQAGIKGFRERFKEKGAALDKNLSDLVPGDTLTQPKFIDYIAKQKERFGSDKNVAAFFESPDMKRLLSAAEADIQKNGGIRFETLMAIRSQVGDMLADPKLLNSIPQGQLRGLYGAVKDDIKGAVQATGNPQAIRANELRDKHWQAGSERLRTMEPAVREGMTPEQTFNRIFTEGKMGATRLWQYRRSMTDQEWNEFATNAMHMIGRNGPDAPFNVTTFLRNTQRMPDETLNAMFGGASRPRMAQDVRELSQIAEKVASGNKAVDPGIAGNAYVLNLLGGGLGSAAGFASGGMTTAGAVGSVGAVAGPHLVARLMASPAFVRWLATPTPMNGLPKHLDRLARLSGQAPEIANELGELSQKLSESLNNGR